MNSNGSFDMIEQERVAEYKLRLTEFLQKMDSHLLCRCKRKTKTYSVRTNTLTKHAIPNPGKLGIVSHSKIKDRMSWDEPCV